MIPIKQEHTEKSTDWLSSIFAIFAIFAILIPILYIFGYVFYTAYLERLGISNQLFPRSTQEYLVYSFHIPMQFYSFIFEILLPPTTNFVFSFEKMRPIIQSVFGVWLLLASFRLIFKKIRPCLTKFFMNFTKAPPSNGVPSKYSQHLAFVNDKWHNIQPVIGDLLLPPIFRLIFLKIWSQFTKFFPKTSKTSSSHGVPSKYSSLTNSLNLLLRIIFGSFFISIFVAFLGVYLANKQIREAKECALISNPTKKDCVSIVSAGKVLASGTFITSSDKHIALYNQGKTSIYELKDYIINVYTAPLPPVKEKAANNVSSSKNK